MIKNIIFDLCGPIITIDLALIEKEFHALGVKEEHPYERLVESGLTEDFESNRITSAVFFDSVRNQFGLPLKDEEITNAWNTLITSFLPQHIQLLRQLRPKYKTFLLSNSDQINGDFFSYYLNHEAGFDFLGECFDQAFFSYQLSMRKPSPDLFRKIVEMHHLDPEETLMIDDREGHCQGARKAGLKAFCLKEGIDICDLFDKDNNLNINV